MFAVAVIAFFGICFLLLVFYLHPSGIPFIYGKAEPLPPSSMMELRDKLEEHVRVLAGEIGERHYLQPAAVNASIAYIRSRFSESGYTPEIHSFGDGNYSNIVAELPGRANSREIIVIGAHYDTVWHSPGADDNASGVAALLEIARLLSGKLHDRTLRFIAFANEEQPFSETAGMGSRAYARSLGDEPVAAMFSLEMLGYYSEEEGSQEYPFPLSWFYPGTASFIAFVSNLSSTGLLLESLHHFRRAATFPVEGLAVPESLVPDIRRSDHAAFWDASIPALMITDTANFRNRYYHTVGDTLETLDFGSMTRVVAGLVYILESMAGPVRGFQSSATYRNIADQ